MGRQSWRPMIQGRRCGKDNSWRLAGVKKIILITSVGSLVGQNILDSLEGIRAELRIIGVNSDPLAPNNFRCDVAYLMPETADEDRFIARLTEVIARERPDLVLAGRDHDLAPLAQLKANRAFPSVLFLTPDPPAVTVVNDKYATAQFARRYALPYPETALTGEEAERLIDRLGFPLICKPRVGYASRGVTIIRTRAEAAAAQARGEYLLQEYLCPPADLATALPDTRFGAPLIHRFVEEDHYSAQAMVGAGGEFLAFFATLHVMEFGRDIVVTPIDAPDMERVSRDYARHLVGLGYVGPFNMNCKRLPDGQFVPYELNGRFTGASASRALLGYPEVVYAIDHFLHGRPIERPRPGPSGRIVMRALGHDLVHLADVERLRAEGRWHRSSRQ